MAFMRKTKIKFFKKVGITKEAYYILREEKRKQKKSMAQIVCDLIEKFK